MLIDLYNDQMDYNEAYEFYCFENCYRIILNYYGVKNNILFMDAALNLVFTETKEDKFNYHIRANTNRSSVLPGFQSKVKVYKDDSLGADEVWKMNKKKIQEGIPIVTGIDVFHLNYQPNYYKTHGAHGVILCGYSQDEKFVNIIDWYKPWFYKGEVNIEDFLLARSSKNESDGNIFSGITIGNAWIELEREGWKCDVHQILSSFIHYTSSKYYCNDNIDRGNIPLEDKIISQGIYALKDLYKVIQNYENSEPELRKEFLLSLHKNMHRVSRRKRFFKYYLTVASQLINVDELNDLINAQSLIIEKWERLILIILKAGMLNTDKLYDSILVAFQGVIGLEEDLFDYINKLIISL